MFTNENYPFKNNYPSASKARREVSNLTERKNPHTPVYGVKEFVRLSVINFDPNYLMTGKTDGLNEKSGHLLQKPMSHNFI